VAAETHDHADVAHAFGPNSQPSRSLGARDPTSGLAAALI